MSKEDFISIFEATLLCADLDITGLSLLDDNTAQTEFRGGGILRKEGLLYERRD